MSDINVNQVLAQMRAMAAEAQSGVKTRPMEEATSFQSLLKQSLDKVNETQQEAKALTQAFELGETDADLAQVMVAVQKSNLSFQAMVEVRNKLVEAYREVMNMPI